MSSLASEQHAQLLRRFEPVLRFTHGERFFPMDVERYVHHSSLWIHHPNGELQRLFGEGELTLEKLAQTRLAPFDSIQYIKFIEPMRIAEMASYSLQQTLSKEGR